MPEKPLELVLGVAKSAQIEKYRLMPPPDAAGCVKHPVLRVLNTRSLSTLKLKPAAEVVRSAVATGAQFERHRFF